MFRYLNGSRRNHEMGPIPSERALKTMGIETQNNSFDELEPEISLVKGGPGPSAGDGAMGNLAPPGDREESASHHFPSGPAAFHGCRLIIPCGKRDAGPTN